MEKNFRAEVVLENIIHLIVFSPIETCLFLTYEEAVSLTSNLSSIFFNLPPLGFFNAVDTTLCWKILSDNDAGVTHKKYEVRPTGGCLRVICGLDAFVAGYK